MTTPEAPRTFSVAEDGCVHLTFEQLLGDTVDVFAQCRKLSPVIKAGPIYLVISGPHVIELLSGSRMRQVKQFEGEMMVMRGQPATGPMADFTHNTVLLSNGPVHSRRRAPLVKAFARPVLERLRDYVRQEARTIARALPRDQVFDFRELYASPYPARIISTVAGLDPNEWRRFARHIYTMTSALAPPFDQERWKAVEASAEEMFKFVAEALNDRRAHPRQDFITEFVTSADAAGDLTELEIRSQVLGVILGGSDTTRGGLTGIMGLLLEHAAQWADVKADPKLIPGAVSEGLRFEPPVGGGTRFAAVDIELDGARIPAGSPIEVNTISAMRDPALYQDPDTFNIRRTDGPRLLPVFGGGAHRCAGEYLARMELEEALLAIAEECPTIELAGPRQPAKGYTAVREMQPLMVRIPG